MTGQLLKLNEEKDDFATVGDLVEFLDISEEEEVLAKECHKVAHGIEGNIYEFAELHYAYQALTIC